MKTAHSPEILWERHKNGQPASVQDARPRKPTIWQSPQGVWNSESVLPENLGEGASQLGDKEAGS